MISKDLLKIEFDSITTMLEKSDMDVQEKNYKRSLLKTFFEKSIERNEINTQYLSIVHEIKSYVFLRQFGKVITAKDSKRQPGLDYKMDNCYIECIAPTSQAAIHQNGKKYLTLYTTLKDGKPLYCNGRIKEEYIMLCLIGGLNTKSKKIAKDIHKNILEDTEKPCIIFLSLGELSYDFHVSENANEFTQLLVGRGPIKITFDEVNGQLIEQYHYKPTMKKGGKIDINLEFFSPNTNTHISAILFTCSMGSDSYNKTNTFAFLNPFAINKIEEDFFTNIIYWIEEDDFYIPKLNGKKI